MFSDPITSLSVTGELWIRQEDGLQLTVTWNGSRPFQYCYDIKTGAYNTTGNELCDMWFTTTEPEITISRLLLEEKAHTVLIIVRNDVTLVRKTLGINTYEEQRQSQLSVIVVPLIFMLAAIVVIIFGVARYVQTRDR